MKTISKIIVLGTLLLNTAQVHAAAPSGRAFNDPETGVQELVQAVKSSDKASLKAIFGQHADQIISSGDPVQDQNARKIFVRLFEEKNQLEKGEDGRLTLLLGQDQWPFPVPLVSQGSRWIFDSAAGLDEIINRRIGNNELSAISLAKTYVKAQQEYFSRDRDGDGYQEYAQLFASTPGKKNGLFWPRTRGDGPSPLGLVAIEAWSEGYRLGRSASAYHGYFFRILTKQGVHAQGGAKNYITTGGRMTDGFAMLTYPAKWGNSGVMSFLVNQDGVVFQKNLGAETQKVQAAIQSYDPDSTWTKVE